MRTIMRLCTSNSGGDDSLQQSGYSLNGVRRRSRPLLISHRADFRLRRWFRLQAETCLVCNRQAERTCLLYTMCNLPMSRFFRIVRQFCRNLPLLSPQIDRTMNGSTRLVYSLREQIVEQLRTDLLAGRHAEGERLSEAKLVARFGVSRTPVREVL